MLLLVPVSFIFYKHMLENIEFGDNMFVLVGFMTNRSMLYV